MSLSSTTLDDCGDGIISELLTEDDEFVRSLHQKLFPSTQATSLTSDEIRSQLKEVATQPGRLRELLQVTFFNPSWLYKEGFLFLHRTDTAVPADSHHNLVALWTKACLHGLGMVDDPIIGRLLPPGRARRFASMPLVEVCFGPGIRAAGGPTAERMSFMSASRTSAFGRLQQPQRQLLVVGGGFDAGSLRPDVPAGTSSFELDLASVVECKRKILERYVAEFPDEAHRVPSLAAIDLIQNVPSDSLPELWVPPLPTVIVIEAVLSYLPSERRAAVLQDVVCLMKQSEHAVLVLWDQLPDVVTTSDDPVIHATEALALFGLSVETAKTPKKGFVMCLAEIKKE